MIKYCLLLFFIVISIALIAQPGPPPPDPGEPVPLSGMEYLLISGGILGVYRLLKKKFSKA
jgi:hypothetical protein